MPVSKVATPYAIQSHKGIVMTWVYAYVNLNSALGKYFHLHASIDIPDSNLRSSNMQAQVIQALLFCSRCRTGTAVVAESTFLGLHKNRSR
jgi:hypothetical protein